MLIKIVCIVVLFSFSNFFINSENLSFIKEGSTNVVKNHKRKVKDKILARVNGVNILRSDLRIPQITKGGQFFDLEEAINYTLLFQKAAEKKLLPKKVEVEKQIVSLKIHNDLAHLSDKEFKKELESEGFSFQEYEEQLGKMLAVEKIKHAELSERIVVTNQEVENYFNENLEWEKEKYFLKVMQVPASNVNKKGNLIRNKNLKFEWEDLGWIEKKDLSEKLSFVSRMKKGQVCRPIKMGNNYQLVNLTDKKHRRLRTLDERYSEISTTLQLSKREKFEREFEKDLRVNASIVYLI